MEENLKSEIFKKRLSMVSGSSYEYEDLKSKDLHPTYIVGREVFTQAVFEEIADEEDELVAFFTMMFFLGLIMIPIQLLFCDLIKPYDALAIKYLQNLLLMSPNESITKIIGNSLVYFGSMKFLLSFNVLFYLLIDPGISYKVCLMSGCSSYIVFILKIIIHDARPYWIDSDISGIFCRVSYGCPSLGIFGGMVYIYYMKFCIDRAIKSNDFFIRDNLGYLKYSNNLISILFIIFSFIGFFQVLFGENFIYQILLSLLYMFIFIRILIVFNKIIDHISNGARFIINISNEVTVGTFLIILTLSILSIVFYSIVKIELKIPLLWRENIIKCSNDNYDIAEVSLSDTLMQSCAIFNILGATFGVNFILKYMPNPYSWWISEFKVRLIRGLVGFTINYCVLYYSKLILFKNIGANYIIVSLFYSSIGFTSYGILPILFSFVYLTNNDKDKILPLISKKRFLERNISNIDEEKSDN